MRARRRSVRSVAPPEAEAHQHQRRHDVERAEPDDDVDVEIQKRLGGQFLGPVAVAQHGRRHPCGHDRAGYQRPRQGPVRQQPARDLRREQEQRDRRELRADDGRPAQRLERDRQRVHLRSRAVDRAGSAEVVERGEEIRARQRTRVLRAPPGDEQPERDADAAGQHGQRGRGIRPCRAERRHHQREGLSVALDAPGRRLPRGHVRRRLTQVGERYQADAVHGDHAVPNLQPGALGR